MKNRLKYSLSQLGLFPYLDGIRQVPQAVGWLRKGCIGPAPPPSKDRSLKLTCNDIKLDHLSKPEPILVTL
jgi:hypothetical protein